MQELSDGFIQNLEEFVQTLEKFLQYLEEFIKNTVELTYRSGRSRILSNFLVLFFKKLEIMNNDQSAYSGHFNK